MTALWIILGVLGFLIAIIIVLLHISIRVYLEVDNQSVSLEVKYLGFSLYKLKLPEKDKASAPSGSKSEHEPTSEPAIEITEIHEAEEIKSEPSVPSKSAPKLKKSEKNASPKKKGDEGSEPSLIDKFNAYKQFIPAGKTAIKKLLKLIRFYHFRLGLTVGNDDPYKAGVSFGQTNAVIYTALGLLCCIFSVKIDSTEIKCDFKNKTTDFELSTAIYARPSAILALAMYIWIYYNKIKKSTEQLDNSAKEKTNDE